jgi:diketogulonate reductase-like aldo/keto reductase
VAEAVQGIRNKVFIATKFSPEHNSYDSVIKSAEASLQRLNTDYIDLYQVHWPNPQIPIEETLQAISRLVQAGKVRYAGVSNFSRRQLTEASSGPGVEIVSLQTEYNLFDRSIEQDLLPYCENNRLTLMAYSPLDQGKIAAGGKKMQVLQELAAKYNATISQVTLNWLVAHHPVVVIPKAVKPDHIKQNASAADFIMSQEDYEIIEKTFEPCYALVPADRIRVIMRGAGNRMVYQTLEEAIENKLNFVPSPVDLAKDMSRGDTVKPVRLTRTADKTGKYDYDLVEGRVRYWAWVIAHQGKLPVPAIIRE